MFSKRSGNFREYTIINYLYVNNYVTDGVFLFYPTSFVGLRLCVVNNY
jgi:hypothetical protein